MHFISKALLRETKVRALSPCICTTSTTLSPPFMRRMLSQEAKGNKSITEEPLSFPIQIPITPLWAQFSITLTPPHKQNQEKEESEWEVQEQVVDESKREGGSHRSAAPGT